MLSKENCEDILSFAKLQITSFNKLSQTIVFDEEFNKEQYYIFKVNNEIMEALNKPNLSFSIKGNNNDTAVLCTQNKNYEIRESETSNTLLVLPNIELFNKDNNENVDFLTKTISVSSNCNKFYELSIRRAKIGDIYKLLQNSILYHHIEEDINQKYFNFNSLLEKVAMSEEELKYLLKEVKVYEIKGMLRMLYIEYVYDIVLKILECSFENDYSIWNLSQNNVHVMLNGLFPSEILKQTLNHYFEKILQNDEDTYWKVNEIEVTRCFAEQILNNSKVINLNDFIILWNKCLPDEISGQLNNLYGLAVIDENCLPNTIKLVKAFTLSSEPEERFKELFTHKSHWKQEELEGFLQDIVPIESSATQLIMRYCRCTNSAKTKIFSKR